VSSLVGYFLVHRRALESWLWQLPAPQFKVAFTILAMANWKEGKTFSGGEVVVVERGQLMTSLATLKEKSGESTRTIRTTITNLSKAGFLTNQSTKRFRLITVVNYETYQNPAGATDKVTDSPATKQRQSSDNPPTTIEASKQVNRQSSKQSLFDFDAVYQAYPRKQGKKTGMAKVQRMVTTREDYDALRRAVEKMAKGWRGQDTTYCPHWSSFVSQERWRDDDLPMPSVDQCRPAARPVPSFEPTFDELMGLARKVGAVKE
jgi:hypothetical protein